MLGRIGTMRGICLALLPLLLVTSMGVASAVDPDWEGHSLPSIGQSASVALAGSSPPPRVIAACPNLADAVIDAYDPADGYLYVAEGSAPASIAVVEPLCHVLKIIHSSRPVLSQVIDGFVYDPLTREMVALDAGGLAYVLHGTSLVDTVNMGAQSFHCPSLGSWDSALSTITVADYCGGGVDLLYLSEVNGTTKGTAVLNAFDQGNRPEGVLDAVGYIFAAGNFVDVFDQRTLTYVGSFGLNVIPTGYLTELSWDAFNHTVVVAIAFDFSYQSHNAVYFLHTDSIRTHTFTFGRLPIHGILDDGAGGVAYSPASHGLYVSAAGGTNLWIVNAFGSLQHLYLQRYDGMGWITYDPANSDMFVIGALAMYVVT